MDSTAPVDEESLPINVLGLVSICVFYLIVLAIGVWAGWSQKKKQNQADDQETVMLAGRNIGLLVGVMTKGGMYLLILKIVKKKRQKIVEKIVKKIVKKSSKNHQKNRQKTHQKLVKKADDQETVMLAGRNIGLLVGVMTMGGMYLLIF